MSTVPELSDAQLLTIYTFDIDNDDTPELGDTE